METLENYIDQLRECQSGRISRNIIVSALNLINEKGGNATTLGGHDFSYFATKADLSRWLY